MQHQHASHSRRRGFRPAAVASKQERHRLFRAIPASNGTLAAEMFTRRSLPGAISWQRLLRPRVLQLGAPVLAMLLLATARLLGPQPPAVPTSAILATTRATPLAVAEAGCATSNPLACIAAYNAASVAAGHSGDVALLQPFLAPGSSARAAVEREFARRAAVGETHTATMQRWAVVEQQQAPLSAVIETQEQWDDTLISGGQVQEVRRGILQRVRYQLRREHPAASWQIHTVTSTTVLP